MAMVTFNARLYQLIMLLQNTRCVPCNRRIQPLESRENSFVVSRRPIMEWLSHRIISMFFCFIYQAKASVLYFIIVLAIRKKERKKEYKMPFYVHVMISVTIQGFLHLFSSQFF